MSMANELQELQVQDRELAAQCSTALVPVPKPRRLYVHRVAGQGPSQPLGLGRRSSDLHAGTSDPDPDRLLEQLLDERQQQEQATAQTAGLELAMMQPTPKQPKPNKPQPETMPAPPPPRPPAHPGFGGWRSGAAVPWQQRQQQDWWMVPAQEQLNDWQGRQGQEWQWQGKGGKGWQNEGWQRQGQGWSESPRQQAMQPRQQQQQQQGGMVNVRVSISGDGDDAVEATIAFQA